MVILCINKKYLTFTTNSTITFKNKPMNTSILKDYVCDKFGNVFKLQKRNLHYFI